MSYRLSWFVFCVIAVLAVGFIVAGFLGFLPFDLEPLAWALLTYGGITVLAIVVRSLIRFARGDRRALRGYWVWLNTAGAPRRGGVRPERWLDPTNPYVARGMLGAVLAAILGLMLTASLYWASVALGWIGTAALLLGIGLLLLPAAGLLRLRPDSWGERPWLPTLVLASIAAVGMVLIWIALSRIFPRLLSGLPS